ncbi:nicotinic acid phosphoribosyltransferase [Candidatus Scalindua japonica]|uniref:Nicotinate phosphoribosyltransferase n=1 Tax=Candidatus Scalindua japonica TaxID=1284222 RepID=A0A286TYB7_9BACT|nr:nicotinate phosphoribosyltransferase [Candidatus Scalindua japonica]GAX60893.1 nicotinic acid phosphoribosyltransferase [Candidatus Scalindua japonica]
MKKNTGKPKSLFLDDANTCISTDLYQLTMIAGYFEHGINHKSTFELFVRDLPERRSYLIAAGLEQAVHYIANISFTAEYVKYLKELPVFKNVSNKFFNYLEDFSFKGDLYAVPEGTVIFANEPIIRVTASMIEAQIIETYLLSIINYQTLIASKASRVVFAADGRKVIDFGTRRAHGPQAGVLAARACYIGGCVGTSNVLAARELGIPPIGTVAHSWIMAYGDEYESFQDFHNVFPDNTVLLIDTYDTIKGAKLATKIGMKLKGVRLDSGNITLLSKRVRRILDEAGLGHVKITASSDLNEYKIAQMLAKGACIDSFGVGTEMVTSKDTPALGGVYKLVEQEIKGKVVPKMKLSKEKETYPSKKQIYRFLNKRGLYKKDIIGLVDEEFDAEELLQPIMKKGKLVYKIPTVKQIQKTVEKNMSRLPKKFKDLNCKTAYPVTISRRLKKVMEKIKSGHIAF